MQNPHAHTKFTAPHKYILYCMHTQIHAHTRPAVGRSLLGYMAFSYVANHPAMGWATGYMMAFSAAVVAVVTALLLVTSPSTPLLSDGSGKNKHE